MRGGSAGRLATQCRVFTVFDQEAIAWQATQIQILLSSRPCVIFGAVTLPCPTASQLGREC